MPQTVALGAAAGAVDEPLLLANGSFELKFRPATLDAGDAPGRALFSKNGEGQGTGGHVSVLLRENGGVLATIGDAENDFSLQSAAGVVRVGEPAHLVVTFGQSGLRMFVDGAQVARDPGITIGLDAGQGNYEPLVLGMDAGLPGFAGVIDEFAVYDRALTARQIDRLFQAGEQGGRLVGTAGDDEIIGGPENQTLLGGAGADTLRAGAGNDVLRGGPGPDVLQGGQGNDQLFGRGGADRMSGGAGNDFLVGGPGKDVLAGGPGSDVFRLDRLSERADRILDFEPGPGGDVLDIDALLSAFDPGRPDDFVRLDDINGNTRLSVNVDGAGTDYVGVLNLVGHGGLDLAQLIDDGNLSLGNGTV